MEDAARFEIFELVERIDPAAGVKREFLAAVANDLHLDILPRLDSGNPGDRVFLFAGEAESRGSLALAELEREDAHSDEVGAVDPLEALGDDRADSEQDGALRRPVA